MKVIVLVILVGCAVTLADEGGSEYSADPESFLNDLMLTFGDVCNSDCDAVNDVKPELAKKPEETNCKSVGSMKQVIDKEKMKQLSEKLKTLLTESFSKIKECILVCVKELWENLKIKFIGYFNSNKLMALPDFDKEKLLVIFKNKFTGYFNNNKLTALPDFDKEKLFEIFKNKFTEYFNSNKLMALPDFNKEKLLEIFKNPVFKNMDHKAASEFLGNIFGQGTQIFEKMDPKAVREYFGKMFGQSTQLRDRIMNVKNGLKNITDVNLWKNFSKDEFIKHLKDFVGNLHKP